MGEDSAPEEGTPEERGETEAPAEEPVAEEPTPQLWAGKYSTAEELEKAYSELQSKLGEQGSELGQEVRRLRDELDQLRQQPHPEPAQPFNEEAYDTLVDEDPQRALAYAQQAGDGYRMQQALKSWYDIDPYSATQWQLDAVSRQQAQQRQQELARYEEHVQNQQLGNAFANVRARHPDFDQLEPRMIEAANALPELLLPLQNNAPDSKERVIEALYRYAAYQAQTGQPPPPATETPQEVPHVASATSVPQGSQRPRDPFLEAFEKAVDEDAGNALPWNR